MGFCMFLGTTFSMSPEFSALRYSLTDPLAHRSMQSWFVLFGLFHQYLGVKNEHSHFHLWVNGSQLFAELFWCFLPFCDTLLSVQQNVFLVYFFPQNSALLWGLHNAQEGPSSWYATYDVQVYLLFSEGLLTEWISMYISREWDFVLI